MTIENGAAASSGAEGGGGDTGLDTSLEGAATSSAGTEFSEGQQSGSESAPSRHKVKWLGREEELGVEDLVKRFSDDHEFEFRGPKGQPVKARWADIERHVQLSSGAQEAIKRAAAERQQFQQSIEWARENPGLALEQLFGVEDHEQWAFEIAARKYQREAELTQLAQTDPVAHQRELARIFNEKLKAKQALTERQQQQQREAAERRQAAQAYEQQVRAALQANGIKPTPHNLARAAAIAREQGQLGIDLEPRQIAYELRKAWDAEVLEHLDSYQIEKLLGYLGDGRRAKLREAEIAAVKQARKTEQQQQKPKPRPPEEGERDKKNGRSIDSLKIPGFGGGL